MYIGDIAYSLPKLTIDAKKIAEWTGGDEKFVADKIGIKERRFLSGEESTLDIAKQAVNNLFDQNQKVLKKEEIDFLIVVTQNPDYQLPHTSAILQGELGLRTDVAAFDLSLGCSGWIYALAVAKGLMQSLQYSKGLVVTADPYSKSMDKSDKSTVSVFGDAAAATLLSGESGIAEVLDFSLGTDGTKYENLIVRNGGAKSPITSLFQDNKLNFNNDQGLYMGGREILQFMLENVPGVVEDNLKKNHLKQDDIDYYLFHQASKYMLVTLARKMGIDIERVPINIEKIGNTVSSTIPILIKDLMDQKKLAGKTTLASGFGVGLSWGATVLKFKENL